MYHNKNTTEGHTATLQENNKINVESTISSQILAVTNPWKVATFVLSITLIFTLTFGALWFMGAVQITGMNNTMAVKSNVGNKIEKDTTVLPSIIPIRVDLPITWGDIGKQLLSTGIIDEQKFVQLYEARGGMSEMMKLMLYENNNETIVMTENNAQDLLNLFWAFGLANINPILTEGPMMDEKYGGDPSRFASTGGWTIRSGDIMEHYNKHPFVPLTPEQQTRVESVSKGIFRPCCNNATYFPDCNHGMAMLGLLELLAANDISEDDMYTIALGANIYWFPNTYETVSTFLTEKGTSFEDVSPKDLLGEGLSSASGFAAVRSAITQPASQQQGGGGCSV